MQAPLTFGSVCSGIEAAHLAFSPLGFKQLWSSEIAAFPCSVLDHHYPDVFNAGDMVNLPELIKRGSLAPPDLVCGGTPCQAFSLAGWKNGLDDDRGMLTIKFIEIADSIDEVRIARNQNQCIVLWENVEGVLNDKTNAFGNFIAGLAGYSEELKINKWAKAGCLYGPKRNIAWRVLDAKYFGLPQQRRRLYVLAGGKEFRPELVLFEIASKQQSGRLKGFSYDEPREHPMLFEDAADHKPVGFSPTVSIYQFFRSYTDCLYAAYGTKWNGNAAAYNGSLYVAQNARLRRFTPLECERLMGLPDNYTLVPGYTDTSRYRAIGNSWAVPVIRWLGERIVERSLDLNERDLEIFKGIPSTRNNLGAPLFQLMDYLSLDNEHDLNTSSMPMLPRKGNLMDVIQIENVSEKYFLSLDACKGILRRKKERGLKMNQDLERLLEDSIDTGSIVVSELERVDGIGQSTVNNCVLPVVSSPLAGV